jgi:hypothetical protein
MKKLAFFLFLFFVLIAGAYALMQGPFGRNLTRNLLTSAVQKSGYEVTIDQVEGTLPHQIDLKGVSVKGNQVNITAQSIHLRPVLWRLFKREIAFNDVHARSITFDQGTPFDFDGKFRLTKNRAFLRGQISDWHFSVRFNQNKRIATWIASHSDVVIKGQALLDSRNQLERANARIRKKPFSANVLIARRDAEYDLMGTWQAFERKGKGTAVWANRTLKGELTAPSFVQVLFDLQLTPDGLINGTNTISIENLQALQIPAVYGKLQANAEWHPVGKIQGLHLDATTTDFYYGPFFAQKASLYSDLEDPFHTVNGLIDLEFEKAKWDGLELETLSLETTSTDGNWPFRLFAEGEWKHPLEIHMNGVWRKPFIADVANLNGTFFNHPFVLSKPVHVEYSSDTFRLSETEISIVGAKAFLHVDRQGDRTDAHVRFIQLPLDFLSLNPLDVAVNGRINLEADVHEEKNRLRGDLKATVEQMEVGENKLAANGQFEGHFDKDLLALKGNLHVRNQPLLNLDLALPIHLSLWPFEADLLFHKNAKGHLALKGRIEDFLDFIDFGPHRLEGECDCDLSLSETLYRPQVNGYLHFTNGYYENYYTGTQLQAINADFFAEKNNIYLRSFTAYDLPATGTLTATGEIFLKQSDLYPFHLDASFTNLRFAEIDLVTATADGTIHIEGNSTSALAKGDIKIAESELLIPDHIPRPLPNLQVTYINPIHPVPPPETEYHPYPLHLDLHVTTANPITIAGRGLESEWAGDFHLGGTYTDLAAKGRLELLDGEFNFASRSFKLTDGSVSLSGVEHEMPYINLAGSMETHGVSIIARLKGPLDNPQITLQSVPPLPLGSIMSYLLFGQDLSEISGFQALQLATSIASLAGTGSDVMENTRRSLGVDRLRVITDPDSEGGETVALQVSKYVSKGVLVTFTQNTENSSPDITVEVEIRGNLVLQIESDQSHEQGIFTLKWSKNY